MAHLITPDTLTLREANLRMFREAVQAYCQRVEQNALAEEMGQEEPTLLDLIIARGKDEDDSRRLHRKEFVDAFRWSPFCSDTVADTIFAYFMSLKRQLVHIEDANARTLPHQAARQALDSFVPPPPPPTDAEILQDLEVSSEGTSDDGRRHHYGRDGSAERAFEELKAETLREMGITPIAPEIVSPKGEA